MSNPQLSAPQGQQGPTPIPNRADMAFFSSAAITFGAMMAMLQAEQNAMNGQAQLAQLTTSARTTAVLATATSTQNMSNDDASQLKMQGWEQWASVGSSIATAGMGLGGLGMTARASMHESNMGGFNAETNKFKSTGTLSVGAHDPITGIPTPDSEAVVKSIRSKLLLAGRGNGDGISQEDYKTIMSNGGPDGTFENGTRKTPGYDLRRLTDKSIKENGTEGAVTLKDVFESSSETEVADMQSGVGKGKKHAMKLVAKEHTDIQSYVQIGNAVAQAGSGGPTAQMKGQEAQYMRDKGAQALVQSLSQNSLSLAQETQKAQADQSAQFNNLSGQVWQSINQLVQVDTRG